MGSFLTLVPSLCQQRSEYSQHRSPQSRFVLRINLQLCMELYQYPVSDWQISQAPRSLLVGQVVRFDWLVLTR